VAVTVLIPQPLRGLTANQSKVKSNGANLAACIADLETNFPGMRERLMDDVGQIRRFVNIYINGDDVRFADGLETSLKDGDEVSIVPAVAGG
jgi:molybdopterin synthase sulfur carrier subunit